MGDGVGGGPGGLEVEAAGDAVDVKELAGEVEAGAVAALKGAGVDGAEGHAAAGDELVLEGGARGDGIAVGREEGDEAVQGFLGEGFGG